MTTTLLSFLLSLVALVRGQGKVPAGAGLVISGLIGLVLLGVPLLLSCLL